MKTYIVVFCGAAAAAVLLTPLVAYIAKAKGLIDQPGVRKVHKSAIPRIGGVAIFLSVMSVVLPVMVLDNTIGEAFRRIGVQMLALLGASAFIFLVGLIDDARSVPAKVKLLALIAASLAVCASGSRIQEITVDHLFSLDFAWASWPLTVLWIIGVTVGMNFIDGLDGLAAGISIIVCGTIAVMAFQGGQIAMAILMLALMGSLGGFLVFNFNPAKVFMGDCGSMFLGFIIGAGSVVCTAKTSAMVGLTMPMLALGVPLFDAVLTVIRRGTLDRRSIFSAERGHIHHRLLDKGFSHRRAVLLIYGATLVAAGTGMLLLVTRSVGSLVVIGGAVAFILFVFHWVGSTRVRETRCALQRNAQIRHGAKVDRDHFEHAQLAMREAASFEEWWNVVCRLAQAMAFEQVDLALNGSSRLWRRQVGKRLPFDLTTVKVPLGRLHGEYAYLKVAVNVPDSYETMGRRLMLFGRLIDESKAKMAYAGVPVEAGDGSRPTTEMAVGQPNQSLVMGKMIKASA